MIKKKILSEIAVYTGEVKMPKDFEIDNIELVKNIFISNYCKDMNHPFSREWDKLKTFITDFIRLKYHKSLVPNTTFGKYYERNERSRPLLHLNPVDLMHSPDYILLYGIDIDPKTCEIIIHFDDNRRKGKVYNFNLETNKFIMFPSSQLYYINNSKNSFSNYVQTICFDYVI